MAAADDRSSFTGFGKSATRSATPLFEPLRRQMSLVQRHHQCSSDFSSEYSGDDDRITLGSDRSSQKLVRRRSHLGLRKMLPHVGSSANGFGASLGAGLGAYQQPVRLVPVPTSATSPPLRVHGMAATFELPLLSIAYTQAIKHAQLTVCKASIEVLQRMHDQRGDENAIDEGMSFMEDNAEKPKRRQRRSSLVAPVKLDWHDKLFILTNSGFLLQYSADVSFDRLPEKALRITKESAAFASDLIPGRHWVLQVCSALGRERLPQPSESRSLLSRLHMSSERRQSPKPSPRQPSKFLLVLDSAEEMESWLTTLRNQIEQLGGKKQVPETGRPVSTVAIAQRDSQASQRDSDVHAPGRSARSPNPVDTPFFNQHWGATSSATDPSHARTSPTRSLAMREPERDRDDASATNSVFSRDGHLLESLRDIDSHQFSHLSPVHPSMVTPDSCSPPGSPAWDSSFFRSCESELSRYAEDLRDASRPRPNAAAIVARRRSLQEKVGSGPESPPAQLGSPSVPHGATPSDELPESSSIPLEPTFDFPCPPRRDAGAPRLPPLQPVSSLLGDLNYRASSSPISSTSSTVPSFSIPQRASKSATKSPDSEGPELSLSRQVSQSSLGENDEQSNPSVQAAKAPTYCYGNRRLPPPAMAFSRPLSTVADQPSPARSQDAAYVPIPPHAPETTYLPAARRSPMAAHSPEAAHIPQDTHAPRQTRPPQEAYSSRETHLAQEAYPPRETRPPQEAYSSRETHLAQEAYPSRETQPPRETDAEISPLLTQFPAVPQCQAETCLQTATYSSEATHHPATSYLQGEMHFPTTKHSPMPTHSSTVMQAQQETPSLSPLLTQFPAVPQMPSATNSPVMKRPPGKTHFPVASYYQAATHSPMERHTPLMTQFPTATRSPATTPLNSKYPLDASVASTTRSPLFPNTDAHLSQRPNTVETRHFPERYRENLPPMHAYPVYSPYMAPQNTYGSGPGPAVTPYHNTFAVKPNSQQPSMCHHQSSFTAHSNNSMTTNLVIHPHHTMAYQTLYDDSAYTNFDSSRGRMAARLEPVGLPPVPDRQRLRSRSASSKTQQSRRNAYQPASIPPPVPPPTCNLPPVPPRSPAEIEDEMRALYVI